MKVIGAGFPRTGTASMKAALEQLGFGPCYHMFEIFMNPGHVERWLPLASGEDVNWDRVLDGYRSTQDWPASHFWRELADAYPEAKVILTVRDPHSWYLSFRSLMLPPDRDEAPPPGIMELRPLLRVIGQSYFGEAWRPGEAVPDEEPAVQAFHRHTAAVKEGVSAQRLLVFDVREGWEPLCSFLGVEVPAEPFPHLNDSVWMKQARERLQSEGQMPSPFQQHR